ncbi:hypothetical protein KM043_003722 [Ampulex compressa]|nr:hypothetical protein KM043_003722 [Ampulex compressa]
MSQYVSTYRQDYAWPASKAFTAQPAPSFVPTPTLCTCVADPPNSQTPNAYFGDTHDWSRTGPMGIFLDPKIYPAESGRTADKDSRKPCQPCVFLMKVEENRPALCKSLQEATPCKTTKRTDDADGLKSTYQADYLHKLEDGSCASAKPPVDCRPHLRHPLAKRAADSVGQCCKKKRGRKDEDSDDTRLPPWKSEYQDSIGKVGLAIMKRKTHRGRK